MNDDDFVCFDAVMPLQAFIPHRIIDTLINRVRNDIDVVVCIERRIRLKR